jgi:hypothetical protein
VQVAREMALFKQAYKAEMKDKIKKYVQEVAEKNMEAQ